MKEKILAQLVAKYSGVSKKFLGLYADKLSAKVTEETQIEGVINELDNLLISIPDLAAEFQKEGDTRVSDAKKEWTKAPPKPDKPTKTDPPKDDPAPDDTPAWAKALIEQNQALAAKVASIEKEKTLGTLKQKLAEKLKDVPKDFYEEWSLPENEEGLDAFTEKVTTKYDAFKQDLVNKGLAVQTKPGGGSGGGSNNKATPEEIKNITDKIIK